MTDRKTNDKIILALDASSTNVGWCLAQGEQYIDSGVYHPQGDADQRVREIACWTYIAVRKHDPDIVAIEEPTGHHGNLKTDRLLGRVVGCVEGVCAIEGVTVELINAKTVKATGFSKDAPHLAARLISKTSIGSDEADAIGVWQATLSLLNLYRFMKQTS